jgi:hypothetical protein
VTLLATDLSPLSAPGVVTQSALRPADGLGSKGPRPPRGIHIPVGQPSGVRFGGIVPQNRGNTGARKVGLHYESKVHDILEAIYDVDYRRSPSMLYEDRTGLHRAIPDGILKVSSDLVVIEIKLRHTERAWWQLSRLYVPLLRTMVVPGTRIFAVEICRSYDPSEYFPGPHALVTSLHKLPLDRIGVVQWKI